MKFVQCVSVAAVMLAAAPVLASVMDIDSVVIAERSLFNDYPGSTLFTTNTYPTEVSFSEFNYGADVSAYANGHAAWLSEDAGTTSRQFSAAESFSIMVDMNLTGAGGANAEAGFRVRKPGGDTGIFLAKTNQEVAAFAGGFPFYSFGGSGSGTYTPGTNATMGLIYDAGAGTIEYLYDPDASGVMPMQSSGPLAFALEDLSEVGFYVQIEPTSGLSSGSAVFTNFRIDVPEPASLALLALGGLALVRRR